MSDPQPYINKNRRTDGWSLPTSVIQQVQSTLLHWGYVLLPSDTCYSLGALPIDKSVRNKVNAILGRKDEPISLAFSSYLQVQRFVEMNNTIAMLLERFTPGPITIVCKANADVPKEFTLHTIGSTDGTIGVRIPDSSIERDIAASTKYPLMSIAVRDIETGEAIQDFKRAQDIVSLGIDKAGGAGWAAIEGDPERDSEAFHASHSTVIRVVGLNKVELIREGHIAFTDIQEAIKTLSTWAVSEWT
jgi:L-threonylcarbamoyladenylate synthase